MDILLQRVTDLATLLTVSTARNGPAGIADGATRMPRWAVNGSLWLVLLFVPGSFLLLPALIWWKHRRLR